ncbi:MAG: 30S ribosomal protein S4 [Deltaproteobacteria bacterium]|nr:30S ribosomal protein S4 [Deltaproteobacteria bacterium]
MAHTPVCRICRREGLKLFLKGDRCFTDKCSVERRAYAPGQHGQTSKKLSNYGSQLREKQKVKRLYGVRERQFRKTFSEADRKKGVTGETLLLLLEMRLDNIVYRFGFGRSRAEARRFVRQGHVLVNGVCVDIPSYQVSMGDKIEIKEKSRKVPSIVESVEGAERRGLSGWLKLDKENFLGEVTALPSRAQLTLPIEEQLIVELYSK